MLRRERLRCGLGLLAAIAASLALASAALAAAGGDLDASFGAGGKVTTDFGGHNDGAAAVALQPDGKVVAAGNAGDDFALARYERNGTLDTSFGTEGRVTTDLHADIAEAHAIALQPDGKIVVAGAAGGQLHEDCFTCHFALVRYKRDGALDKSFGASGRVATKIGEDAGALAIALQPDGKIVVAGFTVAGSGPAAMGGVALARYNSDGTLDTSFGTGGKVTDFGGGSASGLALQPDGRIIAAGIADAGSGGGYGNFLLARYNPDGTVDPSFGTGGRVMTDFGGLDDAASAVALERDGRIVAAGTANPSVGNPDFALARYDSRGALDPSFGTSGAVRTSFGHKSDDQASAIALQPDGRIVAAGFTDYDDFALARYAPDGSLDPSFGTGGKVTTGFGRRSRDVAEAVALEPDGKVVAAGSAGGDFALARYNAARLTVKIKGRLVRLDHRRAVMRLACPASEASPPCAGKLVLETAKKFSIHHRERRLILAKHRFSIGAGGDEEVKLHLAGRKARLIRHSSEARKVKAIAHVHDAAGSHARLVKRMRVRPR